MKRIFCAFLCILTILTFFACAEKKEDSYESVPAFTGVNGMVGDSEQLPINPPTDPEIVSSLAKKRLMDVEKYSWAREYPAEFVMLHFCSDVVASRTYPYSVDSIRRTFEKSEVSIHYIITRSGEIQCWIPEERAAWHAGKGEWKGESKYTNLMNKYSIGIEIMAIGSKSDMSQYLTSSQYNSIDKKLIGFTDAQYEAIISLVKDICQRWEIKTDRDHIIGHEEYSTGRKTDPGELFDWNRVINGVNAK